MDDLDNKIHKAIIPQVPTPSHASAGSRAAVRAQEQAKRKASAQQRLLFMMLGVALCILEDEADPDRAGRLIRLARKAAYHLGDAALRRAA